MNLQVLHSAGLLGGLEKFADDIVRKRASSPKFQVHNNALLAVQHNDRFTKIKQDPSGWGRIVESAVGAHLINGSLSYGFNAYYWRERDYEVDFVLERNGKLIAIEVKTNDAKNAKGLNQFRKHYPQTRVVLISSSGIPWEEFLTVNPVELF